MPCFVQLVLFLGTVTRTCGTASRMAQGGGKAPLRTRVDFIEIAKQIWRQTESKKEESN